MMKYISSTVVLAAVLLASLSVSTTEAWSSSTAVHQKIIHPNKNARIIAASAPHKVMSTIPPRSTISLSAATSSNSFSNTMKSAASTTTLGAKAKRMIISNLLRIRTILLHQFSTFTVVLTHKFKVVMLSTILAITALFSPQCAVAKSNLFSLSSSAKDTSSSSIVAPSTSSSGMKKVGKVVVTIGAVGAGASTANAMRGKFACSDDNEKEGGEGEGDEESAPPVNGKKEKESAATTNGSSQQPTATKNNGAVNNNNKVEIEPLSEEWIQQQLNDAEKRSNVLNDAIKMTQSASPPPVTKPSSTKINGTNNKKMSVGNTIGIPSTNKSTPTTTTTQQPLVKNLDSKIQMLQQRNAERTKQQQRIYDEQIQVEMEARQVAIVEAKQKIEAAEREYRKSQQQQQQLQEVEQSVVAVKEVEEEVDSTPTTTATATTTTTSSTRLAIKIGPEGTPAKSKEEDLELTTQVILEYVNSIDGRSGGVVDDDDE